MTVEPLTNTLQAPDEEEEDDDDNASMPENAKFNTTPTNAEGSVK
jgi:hypothetical protein